MRWAFCAVELKFARTHTQTQCARCTRFFRFVRVNFAHNSDFHEGTLTDLNQCGAEQNLPIFILQSNCVCACVCAKDL